MKNLDELLRSLDGPNVTELCVVSGRKPSARSGASLDAVDEATRNSDDILAMLMTLGGSRYIEDLGATPKKWTARVAGFGSVSVTALQRGDEIEARLSVLQREGKSAPKEQPKTEPTREAKKDEPKKEEPRIDAPRIDVAHVRPPPQADGPDSKETKQLARPEVKAISEPPVSRKSGQSMKPKARRSTSTMPKPSLSRVPKVTASDARDGETKLDALLATARASNASDLHLLAERPALLRVAGELVPHGAVLPRANVDAMLMPRIPARLLPRFLAEGSVDFSYESAAHGRFRINVGRHLAGLKASVRLIARELPTVEALKLPPGIAAATSNHQGLVLFTGPTGHGKTTTLTAIVDLLNRTRSQHIICVEDPIEHLHPKKKAFISQREVGTHTQSFAAALKGSLRQDPDVIVVGELRDLDTVRIAVAASETGHLVLGTMSTPSAAKTIDRLIDLFPPADQQQIRLTLAASLRLIVSQRLVPSPDRKHVHAAIELLPSSAPLAALIRDNKTFQIPSVQQRGKALGIVRLDESLAELCVRKQVSIDDAKLFAESPVELEALVLRGGR
jgi:twitching motility protein PilT